MQPKHKMDKPLGFADLVAPAKAPAVKGARLVRGKCSEPEVIVETTAPQVSGFSAEQLLLAPTKMEEVKGEAEPLISLIKQGPWSQLVREPR